MTPKKSEVGVPAMDTFGAQCHCGIFTLHSASLKMTVLLHKQLLVQSFGLKLDRVFSS